MEVSVRTLGIENIGQVVEIKRPGSKTSQHEGGPLMVTGTLDAIELREDGYALVVGGAEYRLKGADMVSICRGIELNNLKAMWKLLDDMHKGLVDLDMEFRAFLGGEGDEPQPSAA